MNKHIPIYIYGGIILLEGIFLMLSQQSSFKLIHMTLGITMSCVAVFAFVAAFIRQRKQVQFAYHELHASALLIYGLCILYLCNTLESLISYTNFLFIFYAFSEIIFCYWLFNLAQKVVTKIVAVRVLLGLIIGIGAVLSMMYPAYSLEIFGVQFILVGINVILYVPELKKDELNENITVGMK